MVGTKGPTKRRGEAQDRRDERKPPLSARWAPVLSGMMALGLAGIVIYALQFRATGGSAGAPSGPPAPTVAAVASVGSALAGAALLVGGLLGFLFGIPRTLQEDRSVEITRDRREQVDSETESQETTYRANTNLEQISDWLTKILVGVGLTQINVLPEKLRLLGAGLAPALGGRSDPGTLSAASSFAIVIAIYFAITGFMYGFLWTRLFLPGAFRRADIEALVGRVRRAEEASREAQQTSREVLRHVEAQAADDAKALALANRQLDQIPGAPDPAPEELEAAIRRASPAVRETLFNLARRVRQLNWTRTTDKPKVQRTIAVFRALSGADSRDHRNHGQLGYALKDQPSPDWAAAEEELTKAIELRGDIRVHGWHLYEFNRALCRIMRDEAFRRGAASALEAREMIYSDLKSASTWHPVMRAILGEEQIRAWMALNDVTEANLAGDE